MLNIDNNAAQQRTALGRRPHGRRFYFQTSMGDCELDAPGRAMLASPPTTEKSYILRDFELADWSPTRTDVYADHRPPVKQHDDIRSGYSNSIEAAEMMRRRRLPGRFLRHHSRQPSAAAAPRSPKLDFANIGRDGLVAYLSR